MLEPHEAESRFFCLVRVPDCGDPDCVGECDHCREYASYGARQEAAARECKRVVAGYLEYDAESVVCTCGRCEERVVELEDADYE